MEFGSFLLFLFLHPAGPDFGNFLRQIDLHAREEVAVAFQGITEKTGILPELMLPSYP